MSLTDTTVWPASYDLFPELDAAGGDKLNTVGKEHDAFHDKLAKGLVAMERRFLGRTRVINIMDPAWGAVSGGSTTANAAALNAARADLETAGGGTIEIPDGIDLPLPGTVGSVLGGTNVTYTGGGTLSTSLTTRGALITIPPGTTNCTVDGLRAVSPNDFMVLVLVESSSSMMSRGIRVTNNRREQCRLVETNVDTVAYSGISTHPTTGNVTRDVYIAGNVGRRTGTNVSSLADILIWYTVGAIVQNNYSSGYPYGIQWWGGDANPAIDGAIANERKTRGILVIGNKMSNILDVLGGGAGIWGSMGYNVVVTGNIVDTCADVGIDFEGCETCTASGNTSIDCPNGTLATFSYNRGVVFSGNVCIQHTDGTFMVRVQNASGTTNNKRVTFIGNDMECVGGIAWCPLETTEHLIFKGNTTHNVRLDTEVNNQKWTVITDNEMTFDRLLSDPAVNVGRNHINGRVKICRNAFASTYSQPSGTRAIRSYQDDPNNAVITLIADNEMVDFGDEPIEIIWAGANPIHKGYTRLINNNLGVVGAHPIITEIGGAPSDIVVAGNHDDINTLWP